MSRGYFANSRIYTMHNLPVLLDCQFTVAAADAGGLGLTGLIGGGIDSVYMHTSTTPAAANPNPAAGGIIVNLSNNYPGLYDVFTSIIQTPETGSQLAVNASGNLTAGAFYIIDAVGTTTTAQWQSIGVPISVTPAQGVAFVANAAAHNPGTSGSGQVKASTYSGLTNIEVVGSGALSVAGGIMPGKGYIMLQCLKNGALTQPADGTVISVCAYLRNSSVLIKGE